MKQEINDNELEQVAGGKVYINTRTKKMGFTSISGVFPIKGSPYEVLELCDSLIGKYATDAEYDKACYDLLVEKGLI